MTGSDSVKVAVRVRPFNQREKAANSKCVVSMEGDSTTLVHPETGDKRTFVFDHSYWSHDGFTETEDGVSVADTASSHYADQRKVFSDLGRGVLSNAWQGYNAALFAYGQTGSGKSYSMLGYGPNRGIVSITCGELFKVMEENTDKTKQFQVSFSMLEIYNEQVRDLLSPSKSQPKGGLKVRQHPTQGFYVEKLKQVPVQTYKHIERQMDQGALNRTTASTNMNATSSRSHMVITIKFKQIYHNSMGESTTKTSEINLVDLAGSERADSTGATGDRLKEGSAINQSLSSLGKVISALAEMAGGKKKVIIPYRDSVLTKLLQGALGGNSRTIMIAAVSPAAMNYVETLSTLRYADRAKAIRNKATVNENPTDKLIRELKEENAKLLAHLKKLQGGGKAIEREDLQRLLAQNEQQMRESQQHWEARLEEAKKEWQRSTVSSPVDDRSQHCPYLQNVNEDPQLTGVIKLCIEQGVQVIGRPEHEDVTIELKGLGIQKQHAELNRRGSEVYIRPCSSRATVTVNGGVVSGKTRLQHQDRVKLGSNSLFLFMGMPGVRTVEDAALYDYDYFQTELAEEAGMSSKMLQESMSTDAGDNDTTDSATLNAVFVEYIHLLPHIHEANSMAAEMGKEVVFAAEIQNLACHDELGRPKHQDILVRVTNKKTNKVWIWSREKFINRKFMMEDLYSRFTDGESNRTDRDTDPFWDPVEDIYLGSCHVWLNNVAYCLASDDLMEVRNHHGKEEGQVKIRLSPCDEKGSPFKDEMIVFDPRQLLGKRQDFTLGIPQGMGIHWVRSDSTRGAFCGFHFYDHPEFIQTRSVCGSVNPRLGFSKQFTVDPVSEEFLDYVQTHALVVELWGTQASEDCDKVDQRSMSLASVQNLKEELAKLRQERDSLFTENQQLRKRSSPQNNATSRLNSKDAFKTTCTVQRSGSAGQILDIEIAKGLKVFFRDIKDVQRKLNNLKTADSTDRVTIEDKQVEQDIGDIDKGLDVCVNHLKDTMLTVIRKKKQDQ